MVPLHPAVDDCVSSSDLVRRFGEWQERALVRPVFVMRRGRPALVLCSFDLMRHLCEHERREAGEDRPVYLDSLREPVLRIDRHGRIRNCNQAARLVFSGSAGPGPGILGTRLGALLPTAIADFVEELVRRVLRAGVVEHGKMVIGARPYALTLLPDGEHAVIIASDASEDAGIACKRTRAEAAAAAIEAHPLVALVHLDLCGNVDGPAPSLARMCRIAPSALAAIRFLTLIDIGSRIAVREAVEAAIKGRQPQSVVATLPRNDGEAMPVTIAFAPRLTGTECHGVSALIVPQMTG
ncbi:PAS domain-containing protein [Sphingomonas sp.]